MLSLDALHSYMQQLCELKMFQTLHVIRLSTT
jgi:hypothetical protein